MTTGEGGMVVTSSVDIAEKCRLIRNHGESIPTSDDSDDFVVNLVGQNFRMTELTAALGWVQTSKLATSTPSAIATTHHLVRV